MSVILRIGRPALSGEIGYVDIWKDRAGHIVMENVDHAVAVDGVELPRELMQPLIKAEYWPAVKAFIDQQLSEATP